jgi:sulfur carrier protein ThiS
MRLTVVLNGPLTRVAGSDTLTIELPATATVADAVRRLAGDADSALAKRLVDDDELPDRSLLLFLNNTPVRAADAALTSVRDRDELLILAPISGG